MTSKANTVQEYEDSLPEDRKLAISQLRKVILANIPKGFTEMMNYGMIGYVVPHSLYPDGYHCDTKLPLPFLNVASQKNFIAIYYMGFCDKSILNWFEQEYAKLVKTKLDMGKSCIRFKKPEQIPFELIGELASKMTVQEWIHWYENMLKPKEK